VASSHEIIKQDIDLMPNQVIERETPGAGRISGQFNRRHSNQDRTINEWVNHYIY
jgi:hypothetical protein